MSVPTDDEDTHWYQDDPPFADPAIQLEYEAALGRFLVAFNKIDNELTDLIRTVLRAHNREDLFEKCAIRVDFSRKVFHLDLLSLVSDPGKLGSAPLDEMKDIAGERNTLAHGHFDQNPADGAYQVKQKGKALEFSVERINGLTARCQIVWDRLRTLQAHYWLEPEIIEEIRDSSRLAPTRKP